MGRSGQPRRRILAWMGLAAGVLLAVIVTALLWRRPADDELQVRPGASRPPAAAGVAADPEYVIVGGVKRKATDIRSAAQASSAGPSAPSFDVGQTMPVPFDANPNVLSVAEAIRTKQHPERLSPVIQPSPFDAKSYRENPRAYLEIVEPGRVFQTAQPAPGVPVLRALGSRLHRITQGETVKLRVATLPKAPVTFTSFDLGRFTANQLTSVTVQADGRGMAEAEFLGDAGTFNRVKILAGSPAATGQVGFVVEVAVSGMERVQGLATTPDVVSK